MRRDVRNPNPPPAETVVDKRPRMMAYKRSINWVLNERPVSDSPTMSQFRPNADSLLDAIEKYEDTLPKYHPLRLARRDIVQYLRTHPDMDGVKQVLGVDDAWIDQLFIDAMAYENTPL